MRVSEKTDGLIARIAMADHAAFQTLFDQTSAQLFAVCLRILCDHTEAEACLEELFAAIWDDADAFRGSDLTPMARLVTEARGLAIARKRARHTVPDVVETQSLFAVTSDMSDTPSDGSSIAAYLPRLQPARALFLRRVCLDGDGYADLAAASDVDVTTVRQSLQKALARIGKHILSQDEVSVAAAEYALFLLPEEEAYAFETRIGHSESLAEEVSVWREQVSDFILSEIPGAVPPVQVFRRLSAALFTEKRETLWGQLWPYAVGGIIAAVVLWLTIRAGILLPV